MLSLYDYFLIFPELFDAANAGVAQRIPTPGGGRLAKVIITFNTALTGASEVLTFSTLAADGTAVAVTGGAVTTTVAASAIGGTVTHEIAVQADGTDIVPEGGGLYVLNDSGATVGIYRVGVVMRR